MGEGRGARRAQNWDNLLWEGSAAGLQHWRGSRGDAAAWGAGNHPPGKGLAGESKQKMGRESAGGWWGMLIVSPLENKEAQPAEGAVQLEAQVHRDPVKCHSCTCAV